MRFDNFVQPTMTTDFVGQRPILQLDRPNSVNNTGKPTLPLDRPIDRSNSANNTGMKLDKIEPSRKTDLQTAPAAVVEPVQKNNELLEKN